MKTENRNGEFTLLRLGSNEPLSPEERKRYGIIAGQINRKARQQAKGTKCFICQKDVTSFCNSHSIPQFVLERVADNGKVSMSLQGEIPTIDKEKGINQAGTFRMICPDCDKHYFSDYEDPKIILEKPSEKILMEIALKNYLHMINNRRNENAIYEILEENPRFLSYPLTGETIEEMDDRDYQKKASAILSALSKKKQGLYYLRFFAVLDYVVPFACQSFFPVIADFEGRIINNIYLLTPSNNLSELHVAVFPLERNSVVMLFTESRADRYGKFFRDLNKLSFVDQLSVINYLIFSYTENVFLNPRTFAEVKKDDAFMDVCQKCTMVQYDTDNPTVEVSSPLPLAVEEFALNKRFDIPNLLSEKYAL